MTNMTNSTIITPRKTTIITIFVKYESRNGKNRQFKSNIRGRSKTLIVKAKSIEHYLDKYYKHDRYKGRGMEYVKALIDSCLADYKENGYVCNSHFDNITGEFIAWPKYPKLIK